MFTHPPFAHRFGFNGKENDNEVKGDGGQQDYGMRIYDTRLGKFLSVDPLAASYPWNSTYAFAENRPVDGIDLDGLEYLRGEDSRVEFKYGRLQLKLENFNLAFQSNWNLSNKEPINWNETSKDPRQKTIGKDLTIAAIQFKTQTPQMQDIPGDLLPSLNKDNLGVGVKSVGKNRPGKREVTRGMAVNVPQGKGGKSLARASIFLDATKFGVETYFNLANSNDQQCLVEDREIAMTKVIQNMNCALADGLIPKEYQNLNSMTNIMNVVLQGINNTNDPNIYQIGMTIYNKYNPSVSREIPSIPVDETYQTPPVILPIK